jgi:hypothetical protein
MTELAKKKFEEVNKIKIEDSRKALDTTNTGISKSIMDRSNSPKQHPNRRTSKSLGKKTKRVTFQKNIVETVLVESFKRYNIDMSLDEAGGKPETIKCKCVIY